MSNKGKSYRRERSIYTKLAIRLASCGYLLLLSILNLNSVPERIISGTVLAGSIVLGLLCIYAMFIPLEKEDEMVEKLYARATGISDNITHFGLILILVIANYYNNEGCSREVISLVISSLLFIVAFIQIVVVYYGSKEGV